MFHITDNFQPGAPITQVPVSWFNKVAHFLNNLIGDGATVACGTPVLKDVAPGTTLSPFGTLKQ